MSNVSTCITYDASTSLIMMTLRGTANAQDVITFYQIAEQYIGIYKCNKLLVDVSELKHDFPASDLLSIMPAISSWLKHCFIARIVSFDGFMHDLFLQKAKRFEITAENFECFRSAKHWLENQPSN
ncbi:hypothetical protein AMS58_15455 [Pseudoalteromonas porphyrae]|uniref:STAS/SEC14 domain-containing protein n=2 Tax=Pseudoalteromonas TaxID=53246 RepID=A0A0N0LV94_9GAMM|nr:MULTISPECIES: hypothetical protein [Pseudoalteromonas]KPH58008.1 hypothetical protein ADS77_18300 [Pseudoalteromonas porphyrae]KPH93780.1 hypothetical protein AMS58_15455 [Pseudoalteromonas porphyrae]NNG43179.1 hypothetical protein [Pseudoalteromonas sp. NEC-BIFX-2020_002]